MNNSVIFENDEPMVKAQITRMIDREDSKVKAYATAIVANSYAVHGIKVMDSAKGLFVAMPNTKVQTKDGQVKYNDTFHPLTQEARTELVDAVMKAYEARIHMAEDYVPFEPSV